MPECIRAHLTVSRGAVRRSRRRNERRSVRQAGSSDQANRFMVKKNLSVMPVTSRSKKTIVMKSTVIEHHFATPPATSERRNCRNGRSRCMKSGLKENITLSVEQAAKRVEEARKADIDQADLEGTAAAQKAVDDLRGEPPAEVRQPQIEAESDIESVLKNPKIAKALQERVTETETKRQEYETAVVEIGKARIAAIIGDFPELANLDPKTQWANAILALHQREPARAQSVYNRLLALEKVEAEVIRLKSEKEAGAKAEMAKYSARENQRFRELTKNIPAKEMQAITAHVPAMLAEAGVTDPRAFLKAIEGQTEFPRASAELLMIKAARYDMMQKAARARPTIPVPQVQRPGVAQPRGSSASTALAALNRKLSQTGNIKDAAALLMAKRKETRR